MESSTLVIGIDASRNRGGGAKVHLKAFLEGINFERNRFSRVHLWAYNELLSEIPNYRWLCKHNPRALEGSLLRQLIWQAFRLQKEASKLGCDILLATDASTVSFFRPMVVMSRDMLSYEPGALLHFGYGAARLRLLVILLIQNLAFRRSQGVIFLSRYASDMIQRSCGYLQNYAVIPHGVGQKFRDVLPRKIWPSDEKEPIRCVYVSPVLEYKHHCEVISAIEKLRGEGFNVSLVFIGDARGAAKKKLTRQLAFSDPLGQYVSLSGFLPHDELPIELNKSDLFIFAPSCENMPNTLIEAMAVGLPIACSNRGPMPEILMDGGVYFDPESPKSIASAVKALLIDADLREKISSRARIISEIYKWERCTRDTLNFIMKCYHEFRKN
jgi:glycosyltransferase involved in cell wall biosynthesis